MGAEEQAWIVDDLQDEKRLVGGTLALLAHPLLGSPVLPGSLAEIPVDGIVNQSQSDIEVQLGAVLI